MRPTWPRYRRKDSIVIIAIAMVWFLTGSFLMLGMLQNPFGPRSKEPASGPKLINSTDMVQVIVFAKNAIQNPRVCDNLRKTLESIFKHASIFLHVHVLADYDSSDDIYDSLVELQQDTGMYFRYSFHQLEPIERREKGMIQILRKYFFTEPVPKYDDDIFFLTPGFHRVFPDLDRAIFLDTDLRFRDDIRKLWDLFADFKEDNIIGIAHDLQPMYRSKFAAYREKNPETDVGSPNPGKQGFNTGVMLMDLHRMRKSRLYNRSFFESSLTSLVKKYEFNGDLGHQDFLTLMGMEYPELFYLLPCSWNRQLEMTWATKVESSLFNDYHKCDGEINVYHANAGSKLPPEVSG